MYSKNFSSYRAGGFGQIDPFDRRSAFEVPRSDTANIPKNYRGIYFSQKKPEVKKSEIEESVIRHTAIETKEKAPEPRGRQMPMALPPPRSEVKAEHRAPAEEKTKEHKEKKEGGDSHRLDLEELLIAGLIVVLLREGANDMLPLELALLLL